MNNENLIEVVDSESLDAALRIEMESPELNRAGFVRAPNAQAQWILLTNNAFSLVNLSPSDHKPLRDYLAITLSKFNRMENVFGFLNGYAYWVRRLTPGGMSEAVSQQIADLGLLYVTIFRKYAEYRHNTRSISSSQKLTEGLYRRLAQDKSDKEDWESVAIRYMTEHFGLSLMVLNALANEAGSPVDLSYMSEGIRFPTDSEAVNDVKEMDEFEQWITRPDQSKIVLN